MKFCYISNDTIFTHYIKIFLFREALQLITVIAIELFVLPKFLYRWVNEISLNKVIWFCVTDRCETSQFSCDTSYRKKQGMSLSDRWHAVCSIACTVENLQVLPFIYPTYLASQTVLLYLFFNFTKKRNPEQEITPPFVITTSGTCR